MKLKYPALGTAVVGVVLLLPQFANADVVIYGKVHLSGDYIDTGAQTGQALSSNSSWIGFKGKEVLTDTVKAVWQIELGVGIEESNSENALFSGRDRFFGLETQSGTLKLGSYSTPSKVLGEKFDQFIRTVADRRGLLGYDPVNATNFDTRATDAVMYSSPSIAGLTVNLLRSIGSASADTASGADEKPITSMSALYDKKSYYAGIAYEDQEAKDITALRFLAGVVVANSKINIIYEQLSSNVASNDRSVFGLSGSYGFGVYTFKGQLLNARDYKDGADTGALVMSGGVYQKIAKSFTVYGILSRLENADNGTYSLSANEAGHGDVFSPSGSGSNMHAISAGMVYDF